MMMTMMIMVMIDETLMITSAQIAAITFRVPSLVSHLTQNAHETISALLAAVYFSGTRR
jgi:hypothetical protein